MNRRQFLSLAGLVPFVHRHPALQAPTRNAAWNQLKNNCMVFYDSLLELNQALKRAEFTDSGVTNISMIRAIHRARSLYTDVGRALKQLEKFI